MNKTALALSGLAIFYFSTPLFADVHVKFIEGAPKDRFEILNVGTCDLEAADLTIDFAASNAGLIFKIYLVPSSVEVKAPRKHIKLAK